MALGSSEKLISDSATQNALVAKKSIVAKSKIKKDEIFSEQNITVMRPGTGLSAMRWDSVIGKPAIKDFEKGDMIVM
jgi:N,N'-diacetyllegionaminate synthase